MNSTKIKKIFPTYFELFLFIGFTEVVFNFVFRSLGFHPFAMVPYLRLFNVAVSFLYTLQRGYFRINYISKISLKLSAENGLVLAWLVLTLFGFFLGLINRNSVLYLFTDSIYIFYGYFLYKIYGSNPEIQEECGLDLSKHQKKKFIYAVVFLSLVVFFFKLTFPNFLLVFVLVYALRLLNNGEKKSALLLSIPFWLQILTTNRSILTVILFLIFFYYFQSKYNRKSIKNFYYLMFTFITVSYFFLDDVLFAFMNMLPERSDFKGRIFQVYSIVDGNYNWNSPAFLSLKQRIDEAYMVIDFWLQNPISFLFGGGMGATLEGFSFKDSSVTDTTILGKAYIHNIHILPILLIFRYGFFGLLLFLQLMYISFKYVVTVMTTPKNFPASIVIFQLCWIFYTLPSASHLWTCPLFWVTFSYISNAKKIKTS